MSAPKLSGRVAIVTGASQGIGREICLQLHAEGAYLVCADLKPSGVTADEIPTHELIVKQGGKAIFAQANIGNAKEVEALVAKTVEEYGRLDIYVNNAGICGEASAAKPIDEASEDMLDSHITVNIKGTFYGCKYALRQMKKQERHTRGDRGWIVNLSSTIALVGMPGLPIYAATKGAVASLTKSVAMDGAPHGIHCNAVCPGYTQTSMLDAALGSAFEATKDAVRGTIPMARFGEPRDIARAVVFLSGEDASWVTGTLLPVDGGITAQ